MAAGCIWKSPRPPNTSALRPRKDALNACRMPVTTVRRRHAALVPGRGYFLQGLRTRIANVRNNGKHICSRAVRFTPNGSEGPVPRFLDFWVSEANAPCLYRSQVRQLFYQFVARQIIANSDSEYGRLGRTMVDARRAGLVDWGRHRRHHARAAFLPVVGLPSRRRCRSGQYAGDLWHPQPRRPEVWVEKSAFVGVIEPVCGRWRVPHMAARGLPVALGAICGRSAVRTVLCGRRHADRLLLGRPRPVGLGHGPKSSGGAGALCAAGLGGCHSRA
jgi:hypothetical protein